METISNLLTFYRSNPGTHIRRKLPLRSFSLCSLLPGNKRRGSRDTRRGKEETEVKKVTNAEMEIDRFEQDFVFPLLKNKESDKSCSRRSSDADSCDGIFSEDNTYKMFQLT